MVYIDDTVQVVVDVMKILFNIECPGVSGLEHLGVWISRPTRQKPCWSLV
jgi:hypothetical protein